MIWNTVRKGSLRRENLVKHLTEKSFNSQKAMNAVIQVLLKIQHCPMSRTILMADEMKIASNFIGGSLGTFRQKYISMIAALKTFSTFLTLTR